MLNCIWYKIISGQKTCPNIIVEDNGNQSSYITPLSQVLAFWASLLHAWCWWMVYRNIWERQEREDNSISKTVGWFQWTFWKVSFTSVLLTKIGSFGWYAKDPEYLLAQIFNLEVQEIASSNVSCCSGLQIFGSWRCWKKTMECD